MTTVSDGLMGGGECKQEEMSYLSIEVDIKEDDGFFYELIKISVFNQYFNQ